MALTSRMPLWPPSRAACASPWKSRGPPSSWPARRRASSTAPIFSSTTALRRSDPGRRRSRLSYDVGQELAFQKDDLVLQHQFPLFQALKLDLAHGRGFRQAGDHVVEIAMLQAQFLELSAQRFGIGHDCGITEKAGLFVTVRGTRERLDLRPLAIAEVGVGRSEEHTSELQSHSDL